MSEASFDPYYKWLGIPREEQPPHFYRLLGISPFEADGDVIETAADQRMAHLRTFQSGKNGALSQKLLNELAAAKLTLLKPEKKADYDQSLRAKLASQQQAATSQPKPAARPLLKAQALDERAVNPVVAPSAAPQIPAPKRAARHGAAPHIHPGLIAAVGAMASIIAVVIGVLVYRAVTAGPAPAVASNMHVDESDSTPTSGIAPPPSLPEPAVPVAPADPRPAVGPTTPPPQEEPQDPPPAEPAETAAPAPDPIPTPEPTPDPREVIVAPPATQPMGLDKPTLPAVPSETAVAEATKVIKELFQKEYAATRPEDKRALAKKLLVQAGEAASDPAAHFALLHESQRLAVAAADFETASAAIDAKAASFAVEPLALKAESLQAIAKLARLPEHHQAIAEASLALVDAAADAEQFEAARTLALVAAASGRKSRNLELAKRADQRGKEIEAQRKAFAGLQAAREALARDPDDPDANLALGKYLCLVQGDWAKGFPLLARGSDDQLKKLAQRDLARPAAPDQQIQLADDWWAYGETERAFRGRAAYWYDAALPTLTGLAKVRIEKRLDEVAQSGLDGGIGLGSLAASAVVLLTFEKSTLVEGSGFALQDLSPKQSVFKGKARLVPGVAGTAAFFSGQNDSINGGKDIPHANAPRSYSLWIKSEAGGDGRYFMTGGTADGGFQIMFVIGAVRGTWQIDLYNDGVDSKIPPDTRWHHHYAVYDGKELAYLIDGVLVGRKACDLATRESGLGIGGTPITVDEFAVFNRALTEKEVARLFQMGKSRRVLKEKE